MSLPDWPEAKLLTRDFGFYSAYFTIGEPGSRAILLQHGLAASGYQFIRDAEWFAERGFFVIVPDLRGHGRSLVPGEYSRSDFTRRKLMDDLVAILDAESVEHLDWVGNSLGGILALEMMANHPDRLDRVITFGTAFSLNIPEPLVGVLGATIRTVGATVPALVGAPLTSQYPAAQEVLQYMLENMQVEPMLHVASNVAQYNLFEAALDFPRPFLMIRADRDQQVNWANEPFLPHIVGTPNFTLVDLAEAGHCANLDRPQQVRRLIMDFVTNGAA